MKIGIITQPLHTNYGGLLQNYALQQILKRMGHDVTTVRYFNPDRSLLDKWKGWLKYSVLHRLHPDRYKTPAYVINNREISEIRKNTDVFVDKYIYCTPIIDSHEGFANLNNAGYEAFVVGSDQCWRLEYNREFLYEMFLSFLPAESSVRRVAYAASFGTGEWELDEEQTQRCAALAKKFSSISVREDSGIELCKDYLGVGSSQVLDPTLLLDRNDYLELLKKEPDNVPQKSLFTYILDPNPDTAKFIETVSGATGLTPFSIMPRQADSYKAFFRMKKHLKEYVFPSPLRWLRAISDSEMTIVDSFHGMVFSIIFNKPFWVIGNASRGMARFKSLLKVFGLEERLVQINDVDKIDVKQPVDWERVNKILDAERAGSISFLKDSLDSSRQCPL